MQLDLSRSWIVGDRAHDLAAGAAAGLAGGTLLAADAQERQAAGKLAAPGLLSRRRPISPVPSPR